MKERPDHEAVKVMMARALALSMFDGDVEYGSGVTLAISNKASPAYVSADKLAAIIADWFADHYEPTPGSAAATMNYEARRVA